MKNFQAYKKVNYIKYLKNCAAQSRNASDYRYVSDCRSRGHLFDPGRSHTFVEIDHEIISTAILLPSADARRVVASQKQKCVQEVLVNCFVKLAQRKSVVR